MFQNQADVMKEQEAKLRSKFPGLGGRPGGGGSALLQKRLSKGVSSVFYYISASAIFKSQPTMW